MSWKKPESQIQIDPCLSSELEAVETLEMVEFAVQHPFLYEQLRSIHRSGPLWDGDLISKGDRDALVSVGAATKVIVRGQQGYQACTYVGHRLLRVYAFLARKEADRED